MSTGENWGTFLCLDGGIPGPKSMQEGCRQDDVGIPEKVELASELGRGGNRIYPGAPRSGHWVQCLDEKITLSPGTKLCLGSTCQSSSRAAEGAGAQSREEGWTPPSSLHVLPIFCLSAVRGVHVTP